MPTQKTSDWRERFDKKFLYWVVLGSTMNDGSALRWNVHDGSMPNIEAIKSFIESLLEEQREEIRGEENLSIIKLFSGKKIIKSEYIPSDEVWVGSGKTRGEIMKQRFPLPCLEVK